MNKIQQENLLSTLNIRGLRKVSDTKYECYCVDGTCENHQNEKRRKAGFFWSNEKNEYIYHCFLCGRAKRLTNFVKIYFKDEYIKNFFTEKKQKEIITEKETVKISDELIKNYIEFLLNENILIRLDKCKEPAALKYVEDRKLPKEKYKYLYYTDNYNLIRQQMKELKDEDSDYTMDSDKRIVWFFKDRTNNIIGMQGRTAENKNPRYMIDRFEDKGKMIGGFERADLSKRLYVVEGYLDSLFLPNCVSLNGLHLPTIKYLLEKCGVEELTVVFDNEPLNFQIQKNIDELVELSYKYEGLNVCLLPKDMRKIGKDINDYIKSGMSAESLIAVINNNSYSKANLKVNSIFWS